ncbi:hypothetical protein Leryth_021131 [Lithospermum erythrorhizon]|uniref:Uncharacterized protein n=1 Tax=Lithospermum erythrorhizon TaxID=34254 RepID=A0AAV3RJE5_LITER|nr:hypothetical protein Leryth_021131 [Lithospermum erythrorhizon]
MGSRPRSSIEMAIRRTRNRSINHRRLSRKDHHNKWKSSFSSLLKKRKVSEKLEALKNLIPSSKEKNNNGKLMKNDDLFKETANYIVLLKTQVTILQKLVGFYDSSCGQDQVQEN